MLNKYGQAGGLNAGLGLWLPLDDLGAGAVNLTPNIVGGSGTATFTRATTATTVLPSGLIGSVASGAARSCYSAAGVYLGAFLEGQASTNLMLWCRDFTNAAWTKTSVTAALDQVGADGVANSASSLTATGANGTALQTITQAATSATLAFDVKRITGTGQVLIQQGASTLDITALINSTTWTRVTLNASVLNPAIGFKIVTSGDKIAVDYGQFENLQYATSRIVTTSGTATRNADVLTYAASGNAGATATIYCELSYSIPIPNAAGPMVTIQIDDGTSANRNIIAIPQSTTHVDGQTVSGLSLVADIASGSKSSNTIIKMAYRAQANNFQIACDGVLGALVNTGAVPAVTPTIIRFANDSAPAAPFLGTVKNVRIWTRALADSQLVSLTQ